MIGSRWIVMLVALEGVAQADEPEPTGTFELGAGFDTDNGFLASAKIEQTDLFHTGQRLALTAEIAQHWQAFRVEHGAKDVLGTGLDLDTELFSERRAWSDFTRDGVGGQIEVSRALTAHTRAYVQYRAELVDIEVAPRELAVRTLGLPSLGEGLLASLRAGVVHDTRDAPELPSHGTLLEGYAETGDRALGSDHEWLRLGGSFEHARPLGPLTFRVHGRADYLRSPDGPLPLSLRLQHDGHADVRGYPLGSITTGANLEAMVGGELELPVWRKLGLSVAVFAEAGLRGNLDPAWGPTGGALYRSVGASIIWRSPIGVLRFDWAVPLDGEDRHPQFLFSVGDGF